VDPPCRKRHHRAPLGEIKCTAKARLLNQKIQESLRGQAVRSKDLGDAVSYAGEKTAAKGTAGGATRTARRTAQPTSYGSGCHSFSKIPETKASGHQVEFIHGKLVGRRAVIKIIVHGHSPFVESGPDDGSPQSTALMSTGSPCSLLDGVLHDI